MNLEVLCINDSNRPNVIPISKWLKKGEKYTVIDMVKCNVQGGLLGFKLAEIDLSGCEPYIYFAANRFGVPMPVEELQEADLEEIIV